MKKSIFALAAIALMSFTTGMETKGYKVGDKAADFKLKNIDDKMVSLADYASAKGFIVIFTCNHCPFAKMYEERIMALDKKYASKGYPVIAINPNDPVIVPDDSFDKMKERAKEKSYSFPYLLDETQATAALYGATKTPHIYILQKEGKDNVIKYIGAIDDNSENPGAVKVKYVEDALDALLAGKPVTTNSTKAIGCSIKWKKS